MAYRQTVLLPLFVCLTWVATSKAGDKPGKILPGWGELFNPDGDCEVSVMKEKLKFVVPGKAHDFSAELKLMNAPHVLRPVKGDMIVEVNVCGELKPGPKSTIPGRQSYHGAGLLLINDRDNYLSLHRGALFQANQVRHYANFELRRVGEISLSRFQLQLEDSDTYVRVERRGDRFYALASHDGIHWKAYDEPIVADFPPELRVGVVAVSSSEQPLHCSFENFRIFQKLTYTAPK